MENLWQANAEYIRMADQYVHVPGGSNNHNYANIDLILDVAKRTGAQVDNCNMLAYTHIYSLTDGFVSVGCLGWMGSRIRESKTARAATETWHYFHGYLQALVAIGHDVDL